MRKNPASETVLTFVCIGLLFFFLFGRKEFLYASLGIGMAGLLSKRFSQMLHQAWSFISEKIGGVMSSLLLSLVFFLILTPIALLFQVFNKKTPFHVAQEEKSSFDKRDYLFTAKDLKNPW